MSKLSSMTIEQEIGMGNIIIKPFTKDNLNPNSYDLTLSNQLKRYRRYNILDIKKKNEVAKIKIKDDGMILYPNELYLGCTNEVAGSNKYIPCIEGKSSLARLGILIHLTAGFGDVGFIGQWTLEIVVIKPVKIYPNIKICQVYFDTVEGVVDKLYQGKYSNSVGVVESLSHLDFIHG